MNKKSHSDAAIKSVIAANIKCNEKKQNAITNMPIVVILIICHENVFIFFVLRLMTTCGTSA
jgi:hypothetical protein